MDDTQQKIKKLENTIILNLPFTPNQDQEIAIKKLSKFVFNTYQNSVFILKGYAGTGKTNIISGLTKSIKSVGWKSVLLAPTGRAAKVISNYSKQKAFTIHKKIFDYSLENTENNFSSLSENTHTNTLFIVDEASMINNEIGFDVKTNILESLFEFVFSGTNCKLILVGDNAQLPPVGSNFSPALSPDYLKLNFNLNIFLCELKQVARQKEDSGILFNATKLRVNLLELNFKLPKFETSTDFIRLSGEDLEDTINTCINNYGEENIIIITRSNKRAVQFNQTYRNRIKYLENEINTGDKIMIVKNNYFWLPKTNTEANFIANGDIAEITKIKTKTNLYGFDFCDCEIKLIDYELPPIEVKLLLSTLYTDQANLSAEQQTILYENVIADVTNETNKFIKFQYLKNSPFYNALQVKLAYAVTCHKSQGGQWPIVFIDQGYLTKENLNNEYIRWLYTAITRATERVYLINFNEDFFN
jgi:ATP-dependent exoDNAse (exonuclease V) alpha subunit